MNELAKLKDLINDYWDMAYTEGLGLGSQGTVAQEKLSEINCTIDALVAERDALKANRDEYQIAALPTGYTANELERDNPYNQWMYE